MLATEKFAKWMSTHIHTDRRFGYKYHYHSRSDAHSVALCQFVLEDLLQSCPKLREHAAVGLVVYGVNTTVTWASTGKSKTLDLAIGVGEPGPSMPLLGSSDLPPIRVGMLRDVLISCEAKSVMTEHGKSKPRVYDELSSSHEIVHQGRQDAIATGQPILRHRS